MLAFLDHSPLEYLRYSTVVEEDSHPEDASSTDMSIANSHVSAIRR